VPTIPKIPQAITAIVHLRRAGDVGQNGARLSLAVESGRSERAASRCTIIQANQASRSDASEQKSVRDVCQRYIRYLRMSSRTPRMLQIQSPVARCASSYAITLPKTDRRVAIMNKPTVTSFAQTNPAGVQQCLIPHANSNPPRRDRRDVFCHFHEGTPPTVTLALCF